MVSVLDLNEIQALSIFEFNDLITRNVAEALDALTELVVNGNVGMFGSQADGETAIARIRVNAVCLFGSGFFHIGQ